MSFFIRAQQDAQMKYFFRKILGKEKYFFSSFTPPPRDHVGVSGRLPMHIYSNYDPIGP